MINKNDEKNPRTVLLPFTAPTREAVQSLTKVFYVQTKNSTLTGLVAKA